MAARRKLKTRELQIVFDALSIEGGLLSPAWLSKIAQLQAGAQSEADYRIPRGLNLRDEIGRYWRIAQAHWADLKKGYQVNADPWELSERFAEAAFRDVFGFSSLVAVATTSIAERTYPIGRLALEGRVPVVVAPYNFGLDTLSPLFGDDGRRRSAFGLAQEYLNAQDGALWGLACDGATLRVVRDNASLTRPAWIEADLARIFTEERYSDFAALWLLVHESRFGRGGQPINDCALEVWRNTGRDEGIPARQRLRQGVEEALVALGQGFLSHRENQSLRSDLQSGGLTTKDYFSELLRLVYRLIFLLTVEERGLLHAGTASDNAKLLYAEGYSLRHLSQRAAKRSAHDRFSDLWEATKIVFRGLASGEPRLGLPALAGIFSSDRCKNLDDCKLENQALLFAVFKLAWLRDEGSLARVNWRDMGPEELGSVYEGLLELVPQITKDGRQFAFVTGSETKGNARKMTGSYYTPDSLVQELLDSALEPVIADTIARNPGNPIDALLALSIVDPACGSGHFLLAAARRLAAQVARLQANGTPSASEYRHSLRQVIGRCIFGVDLNPMAVELCKVSLWMEAVEPGLPLTFLNSHIQHGNALLGTTPELMAKGIPDEAWDPIEGDDRKTASALKKRNKVAAEGQRSFETLWSKPTESEEQSVTRAIAELETASDTDVDALTKKEIRWDGILGSREYRHQKFVADAWCAAFVWSKQPGELTDAAPTNELWRQVRDSHGQVPALTTKTVCELAQRYRFFHWQLQFPQVFAKRGFDVVLGNPPWERVKLQEQEFFASRNQEIAKAVNAVTRKKLIAKLPKENSQLWEEWTTASRKAEGESHSIRQSGRYPLCGKGDVNTYAIFAEHNCSILGLRGRAGFIVPSGIATDDTTKDFFVSLLDSRRLASIFDFQSGPGLFGAIGHGTFKFSLTTLAGGRIETAPLFSFYNRSVETARSPEKLFSLSSIEFEVLNPNTRTCPTFRSRRDADINIAMYQRAGILWREADEIHGNPWKLRLMAMFHMANDSELFRESIELEKAGEHIEGNWFVDGRNHHVPLMEAKMVHHFDHRFGDYRDHPDGSENLILPDVPLQRLESPHYTVQGRYWVSLDNIDRRLKSLWHRGWLLGWRDVTKPQNERTVIASLIPKTAVGHKFPLAFSELAPRDVACLYACLCSLALDYAARQKVGGTSLTYFVLKQLPVLAPRTYLVESPWAIGTMLRDWLVQRVLELTYTAWDMELFGRDLGYAGTPFRWDPERRFQLRCELDAAFFHLYGLTRGEIDYVMETFPITRKNDEKMHGEYRTKRVILEIYDALSKAVQTGEPYRTSMDPPPSSAGASHGAFSGDGTPRDYAEALRTGLLFTLVRQSGETGSSLNTLGRALLWLQDSKHAALWLEGASLVDFERVRDSDPLLAVGAADGQATKLLQALENEKAITRDAKGIVRRRAGGSIPNWLPQTPTLTKLAIVMRGALERAENVDAASSPVEKVSTGKARRA